MIEKIKKLGLFGIGALALSEEKINEIAKELIDKGELNKEEGKKFVREVIDEQKKQKEEMEKCVSEIVKEVTGKARIETREDIKRIEVKIDNIEKEVKKLSE
ncbi:MAG: phasin family protein [Methanosarcinales archaeon]